MTQLTSTRAPKQPKQFDHWIQKFGEIIRPTNWIHHHQFLMMFAKEYVWFDSIPLFNRSGGTDGSSGLEWKDLESNSKPLPKPTYIDKIHHRLGKASSINNRNRAELSRAELR